MENPDIRYCDCWAQDHAAGEEEKWYTPLLANSPFSRQPDYGTPPGLMDWD